MGVLRIILALSVLFYHGDSKIFDPFLNGLIAVNVFFVISGFYMALILNTKYAGKPYLLYISNRFLRIYPIYWTILICTIIYYYLLYITVRGGPIPHLYFTKYAFLIYPTFWGFISDLTLLEFRGYYFINPIHLPLVASAWSLVIEVCFYVLAPIIVKRKQSFLFILFLLSLFIRYLVFQLEISGNGAYLLSFIPANLCFFIMGIIAYQQYEQGIFSKQKRLIAGWSIVVLGHILFWQLIPPITIFNILIKEITLFFSVFNLLPGLFSLSRKFYFDKLFGEFSYPIYISHLLIFMILQTSWVNNLSNILFFICYVLLTFTISYFLYAFIDRPLNTFRQTRVNIKDKND